MESKVYIDPYPKTMKMLGLERININCGNNTSIVTPANIAKDMVEILPDEVFIPESKFLDICCKSGIFLTSIRERLMNSKKMIEAIPDYKERYKYITNNQLYGISPNGQCHMYSVREVYGTVGVDNPHILCLGVFDQYKAACLNNNHKILIEEMKKEFGQMKFDVVIGNPPYNKGMDLDFVDLGYKLSKQYVCMITPAKWQTAEANQKVSSKNINYGQFRQIYVPHMSYVCFYPDCLDVFGISQADGITYYLIDKNTYENNCTVQNRCNLQTCVNSTVVRDITKQQSLWNIGNEIVEYLGEYAKYKFEYLYENEFTINVNTQLMQSLTASGAWDWDNSCIRQSYIGKGGFMFNQNGQVLVLNKTRLLRKGEKSSVSASKDVFTSDSIDECKSFYTWINSKFTRFFILINISSLTILNNNTFRFVPAPPSGKFDHIYTDEELYKAFNLPQKYIDIIEAVIKERK